jgi:UDP-GlcNAc:undecaprenyl-phosphate/decaprenyl-phosphate GlcNAc-1-phosphate transferase
VLSLALTELVRRAAIRVGALDHPGDRKMQKEPVPLLGGVAIATTFYLSIFANYFLVEPVRRMGFDWLEHTVLAFLGHDVKVKLLAIAGGGLLIFALGLYDDIKALKPEVKLAGQIVAAVLLVAADIRLDLFLGSLPEVLTPLGGWVAAALTVVWVVAMTNAMNLLDNMDGLSGGVAVIAAFSFFICFLPHGDTFVCLMLLIFAGSVAGFLFHNFNPARIFMGDAGAQFCGYILATAAVLGTFYKETTPSRIAVVAPLLALSVPIFDTCSVIYIRWRRGESIMKGDKRHFSHRLVEAGMSPRQAVEFIYLVAAVAGLGAGLLPKVDATGTLIILLQTAGLFSLIVLLMRAGNRREGSNS